MQSYKTGKMDENEENYLQVRKNISEEASWKQMQKTTFIRWANEHLRHTGEQIVNLERDLSDGMLLTTLLEVLSKKELGTKEMLRHKKLDIVTKALKFLEQNEKIKLVSIDSTAIVDGQTKLILGLLWKLITHYSICLPNNEDKDSVPGDFNVRAWLLNWMKEKLVKLPVKNFKSDWKDGRAIGALVDAVAPGLCPEWEDWDLKESEQNIRVAMETAQEWLDIPQLITPEDMISPEMDELSMITYLAQFPQAKLKPGAPIRARVKTYGPGLEYRGNFVDETATFTVETFSSGTLDILVMNPEKKMIERSSVFRKDGKQTYTCNYVPQIAGEFRVTVKFNDQEILKSPFSVMVKRGTDKEKLLKQELEETENKLLRERKLSQQHEETVESLKEHLTELQDANTSLSELLREEKENLERYEDQNRSLMDQSFELKDRSEEYEMENKSLKNKIAESEQKLNQYMEEMGFLKSELAEEQDRKQQHEREIHALKEELCAIIQTSTDYETESKLLQNQIFHYQEQSKTHEKEILNLKDKLLGVQDESDKYFMEIAALKEQLFEANELLRDTKNVSKSQKEQLLKQEAMVVQMKAENLSLIDQLQDLQENSKQNEIQIISLKENLLEEHKTSEQYKNHINELKTKVSVGEETSKKFEQQTQSLQDELFKQTARAETYAGEIECQKDQINETLVKQKRSEEEVQFLNSQLLEERQKSNRFEEEIKIFENQLQKEQEQLKKQEESALSLMQQSVLQQQMAQQHETENKILKEKCFADQEKLNQYEKTMTCLQDEVYVERQKAITNIQQIEALNDQLLSQRSRSNEDDHKIKHLMQEVLNEKEKSNLHEQEIESSSAHTLYLKEQSEMFEKEIKRLKDQSIKEQQRSDQYKLEIIDLKKQMLVEQLSKQSQCLSEEQERLAKHGKGTPVLNGSIDMPDAVFPKLKAKLLSPVLKEKLFSREVSGKELVGDIALGSLSASMAYFTVLEPGNLSLCLVTGALISATGYRFAVRRKMVPAGFIGTLGACLLFSYTYNTCRYMSPFKCLLVCPLLLQDNSDLQSYIFGL